MKKAGLISSVILFFMANNAPYNRLATERS